MVAALFTDTYLRHRPRRPWCSRGHHSGGAPPALAHDVASGCAVGGHVHRHLHTAAVARVAASDTVTPTRSRAPPEQEIANRNMTTLLSVATRICA